MRKSIIIVVSIVSVLAILFAVALGFTGTNIKVNSSAIKEAGTIKDNQSDSGETMDSISTPTPESTQEKNTEMAITEVQTKVSFTILKPAYIPDGYTLDISQTSGTKFRGTTAQLEQARLTYTKENETLTLLEVLVVGDDPIDSKIASKTPWKFVDINGVQGRLLEKSDGKQLSWEIGKLNLTILGSAYNGNGFTDTSLSKEEMIMMAKSVK
ncbi:MAG: hypothetical protein MPEBLZ_00295 [Candidatus Methanoperedens nitroreducens]|uniref:DUF4367 domain-containing protein n=1 Tax=Candidatus Methanoperedens nitratireducens TaxID=1392998 RepID=A0A0P8ADY7_9EURY|nr:DUF4367 domain-containing protein [Candidatus Methanoperedens sp. BLZ2]KAB2945757.1 MAG: DUF4367 domain-containing protein [Candidatus Methanoperedens sp.]KPQ45121.1 MAG: hypothetical protein MPEBLZ_00295 [Candidatus Methanoperedens sp. BLZ1]MBZ0177428.1 DUF4367 domain-containing protein [Candidatus Methanoperedens nitroreducens]MCX9079813.1 DUF4367 domain-containing protein [Candidatus Methanoperedens sp.]